jgi:hypothetical protein
MKHPDRSLAQPSRHSETLFTGIGGATQGVDALT